MVGAVINSKAMGGVLEYYVVAHVDLQTVMAAVNDALTRGWIPLGGICATNNYDSETRRSQQHFYQALIRR